MEQDKRPRYKGICPECGQEMDLAKMEGGGESDNFADQEKMV